MNEISVPQQIKSSTPKASAPNTQADGVSSGGSTPPAVSNADNHAVGVEDGLSLAVNEQNKPESQQKEQEQLAAAVAKLNDYVQSHERKLDFQMDQDSGETVVTVYDANSEEVIRQIPNEEALELAQRLNQQEPITLFSANV
ncbi:flagellar protein FlaG [Reinekea thalattae]|uniref:Flagellar protein FlaG n=1 Tax=Reinekea thalattae TaxID=2593301 RepID=A0A5C8Z7F6_9GAMM|nr:flagellar protein FlaG [Reinekea thalattae]TXR53249.1 flagellar protein FlaG [Reinekea thalattae]